MQFKLSSKGKKELWRKLYERDKRYDERDKKYVVKCHYCCIKEEDFTVVWGKTFYGGVKRGQTLEIDRIDNSLGYFEANCVLACALCNMAKSDKFDYEEFTRVGDVIREIWQRKSGVAKQPLIEK